MKQPRPSTRCRRCLHTYAAHGLSIPVSHAPEVCPDGLGSFVRKLRPRRASSSFGVGQVGWLYDVMRALLRGGDTAALSRSPECARMARKVDVLKAQSARTAETAAESIKP